MVVDAGAVDSAVMAVDFVDGRLGEVVGGNTVGSRGFAVGLLLSLIELDALGVRFVDVPSDFEVQFALGGGRGGCLCLCVLVWFSFGDDRVRSGLPGL